MDIECMKNGHRWTTDGCFQPNDGRRCLRCSRCGEIKTEYGL